MIKPIPQIGLTGVTGTIGFALCKALASQVQAYHRAPGSGNADQARRFEAARKELESAANINWIESRSPNFDLAALRAMAAGSEVIFHFAGWSAHKINDKHAAEVLSSNVFWTALLSLLAQEARVQRFVFASTRTVYTLDPKTQSAPAVTEDFPLNLGAYQPWVEQVLPPICDLASAYLRGENTSNPQDFIARLLTQHPIPNGTRDLYALSKYMGEQLVARLWENGIAGISLRFSPVFGPSPIDTLTRAIPFIIRLFKSGQELTVMPQRKAFLYLGDLVPTLVRAIDTPVKKEESIIHLGPHLKLISQEEIITHMLTISGSQLPVRRITAPPRQDEILDVSRAQRVLGLTETPFSRALEETYNFFINNRSDL